MAEPHTIAPVALAPLQYWYWQEPNGATAALDRPSSAAN
jgi:hypothetical protein